MTREKRNEIAIEILNKAQQKQTKKTKVEFLEMLRALELAGVKISLHSEYGEVYGVTVDGYTLLRL